MFFRVSMRTDVWAILKRYDESLDKVQQYVFEILWYQRDFLQVLAFRIGASLGAEVSVSTPSAHAPEDEKKEELLGRVFVDKMPWSDKMVDTYKIIYTLSYLNPA